VETLKNERKNIMSIFIAAGYARRPSKILERACLIRAKEYTYQVTALI
jgi:hypothetical protein